ncbi:uncharacterized protein LOC123214298 [Mangifera indica]|uniref:uncharacterized protein LOC123214298 n=1 Tax=Mangifera indica TaxID=29780 RepID=UPI001CFA5BED|nr:uncharacterized protein LOC123214298 [Mangifera indica]
MSTPPLLDQQPPPMAMMQQAYTARSGHGSVGPVIAVLAVITILGVIAGMIGRLCSGRRVMGRREYDFEGWVERKCSSCLDGNIDPHPTRPEIPVAEPVIQAAPPQEIKAEEQEQKSHGAQPSNES